MRILFVLTAPQMTTFLRGHVRQLRACGFDPVICAPDGGDSLRTWTEEEGARVHCIAMERNIRVMRDVATLWRLFRLMRKENPAMTVTLGPKAGLLGGLAAVAARVRCRVQTKWGIRLETLRGASRALVWLADRIASTCAHRILCDSDSGRARAAELKLAPTAKLHTVAKGSANGIDTALFDITPHTIASAIDFREELALDPGTPLIGFVGRITRDKGILELCDAMDLIARESPRAVLAVIGPSEAQTPELLAKLQDVPNLKLLGPRTRMHGIFGALDVLVLPSHREGFGVVVLEAAALGVPTVGFDVTGVRDSVVNGVTGRLVKLGDVDGLAGSVLEYLSDSSLRHMHGCAGRARVVADYQQSMVWSSYFEEFVKLASSRGVDTSMLQWRDAAAAPLDPRLDAMNFPLRRSERESLLHP